MVEILIIYIMSAMVSNIAATYFMAHHFDVKVGGFGVWYVTFIPILNTWFSVFVLNLFMLTTIKACIRNIRRYFRKRKVRSDEKSQN